MSLHTYLLTYLLTVKCCTDSRSWVARWCRLKAVKQYVERQRKFLEINVPRPQLVFQEEAPAGAYISLFSHMGNTAASYIQDKYK